jgi:DNA (cytosine-5)-methyltransferase 1
MTSQQSGAYATITQSGRPTLLDLCGCEGGAAEGYRRAGWSVTSVDLDAAALRRNPADVTVVGDALGFLAEYGHDFDAIHASFPCQRWSANGANTAAQKWPDLITPGRELLNATGRPWVMENVPKAPLRRDLVLCGSMFGLRTVDTDGTTLHLQRHRVFESNVPLTPPHAPHCRTHLAATMPNYGSDCTCAQACVHPRGVQWAGVYGGARKDKVEARTVRRGGYVPPDAGVQSALLGGVPWMTGKGRRECIPPVYAQHVGGLLLAQLRAQEAAA